MKKDARQELEYLVRRNEQCFVKISRTGLASRLNQHVAPIHRQVLNILAICINHTPFKVIAYTAKYRQVTITVISKYRFMVTEVFVNLLTPYDPYRGLPHR